MKIDKVDRRKNEERRKNMPRKRKLTDLDVKMIELA